MNEQEINTCSFCRAKRPVMRQYLHAKNKPVVGNGSDFIYYCNECGIMEQVINQPTMTKADWLRSEIEKLEGNEDMLVKHLVDRFLGWHLPKDFHPDGGISFDREYNVSYNANQGLPPSIHEPTGTNLFTAEQAKEMFRFLLENEDGTSALASIITRYKEELLELEK